MKIVKKKIKDLNHAAYNPRKDLTPDDPEYQKLKKSIVQFDMVEPIIWNEKTGNIVGGHQRAKVLQELGIVETETVVVNLSEQKEKVLNIALNKISGDWDYPKLKDLIVEIDTGEFDIEVTGFDQIELEGIFGYTIEDLEKEWQNMPEYISEDKTSFRRLIIHFRNQDDVNKFSKIIKQELTDKTLSIWYPEKQKQNLKNTYYES